MKKLLSLVIPFLLLACEDSSDCCTVVDTSIDIKYQNASGGSWLNQKELDGESINLYFINKGHKEKVVRSHLDTPKMFFIFQDEASGETIFRLIPSDYIENSKSRTLIEFSATEVDTVDCMYSTENNNIICQKVWYNGQPAWSSDHNGPRLIQVEKN